MDQRAKAVLKYSAKFVLTAVVIGTLYSIVGWRDVFQAISHASGPWLLGMYAFALARQLSDAAQLKHLLQRVGVEVSVKRVFLASQLASFYSLVVPGEIAASAAKWANLSVATGKKALVLNSMLYSKLLHMLVPLLVGLVALLHESPFQTALVPMLGWTLLALVLLAMSMLYHPRLGVWLDALVRRMLGRLPPRFQIKGKFVLESLRDVRSMRLVDHAVMVGFIIFGLALGIVRFYCGIRALDLGVSIFSVLWVIAFVLVGRLLPLTIGNLGIREGLLIVALSAFDISSDRAVALGFLGFTCVALLAVIGGIYQLTLVIRWR